MNLNDIKKSSLLGAHLSIAKGLHNALYHAESLGCNALQIFTKNPTSWKEKTLSPNEAALFTKAVLKTGIKEIAAHTSYLINLAATDNEKQLRSCNSLKKELERSAILEVPYVVLHPGSHMGSGEKKGITQIAKNINEIFDSTSESGARLLLETTAGQGTSIGHKFEQIAEIMNKIVNKKRVGVCIDTCHIFAGGYDIRTEESYNKTMADFDSIIGLENIYLFHLNDSKKDLATKVDRHEHIGQGKIGIKAFELIINDKRFYNIPKIIETPQEKGNDDLILLNLNILKSLLNR